MAQQNENKSQAKNKRNSDEMKLFQAEILERVERLEGGNDSKFDKIYTALDLLIAQSPPKQTHGAGLSNRPSFQNLGVTWRKERIWRSTKESEKPSNRRALVEMKEIILEVHAQTKCETDDDCLQVLIYDLHVQHNLRPSVLKCVDNLCAMVAME
ncbi:hypothetical protein P8452_64984 [Trifolium repens]|nr:hypothetical protein P8452_64984 [Trifolium repens]